VIAAMWMSAPQPAPVAAALPGGLTLAPIAGGSPEADALDPAGINGEGEGPLGADRSVPVGEITFVAVLFAAASVFFGVFPSPLFTLVAHAGRALTGLF
jgi:hypothetical protein